MNDETERENLAEAERIIRIIGASDCLYTQSAPAARKVMAEYDRRGAERDEALGLLRELVAWVNDANGPEDGTSLWVRAEALVERTNQGDETEGENR